MASIAQAGVAQADAAQARGVAQAGAAWRGGPWALSESGEAWLAGKRQNAKMLWAQTLKERFVTSRGGYPVGCPIETLGAVAA